MYTYQFMDGTWRIAKLTNSSFVPPVAGEMRRLYDDAYSSQANAERAIVLILELSGFQLKTTDEEHCDCGGRLVFDDDAGTAYCPSCKSSEKYIPPRKETTL